jgi:hypothetical protein
VAGGESGGRTGEVTVPWHFGQRNAWPAGAASGIDSDWRQAGQTTAAIDEHPRPVAVAGILTAISFSLPDLSKSVHAPS